MIAAKKTGLGFRSLLVLAKIGFEMRSEFSDTFDDDVMDAFGPLVEALENARETLTLAAQDYEWVNDAVFFEACEVAAPSKSKMTTRNTS